MYSIVAVVEALIVAIYLYLEYEHRNWIIHKENLSAIQENALSKVHWPPVS